MKAKIIIERGISTIELSPENKFEETLIDDFHVDKSKYKVEVNSVTEREFNITQGRNIKITLTK